MAGSYYEASNCEAVQSLRDSYERGRGVAEDEGVLEAAFDGNHGWFWRNRTDADVTVTLKTTGAYKDIKRMM
ncbi:hypothetical protein ACX3P0_22145 [Mesorhizobium sp. A556]